MRDKRYLILICACIVLFLGGCSAVSNRRIILSTGFGRDEVFRVGEASCTRQEMEVLLANAKNRYGAVFGEAVTFVDGADETERELTEVIREQTLSLSSQIKAMTLLAQEIGVSLEKEEKESAGACAAAYYASLSEEELTAFHGITQDVLSTMYEEIALADKVYAYAIRDVNPEISDDEARTITVEVICIYKTSPSARERIEEAKRRLQDGEDFSSLLALYNEGEIERATFGAGDDSDIPEAEAFDLETGEVSDIIEREDAWYILRCVSAFDREQTRANKVRIVARRRNEAFGVLYDSFVETIPVQLNEALWEEITFPGEEVQTADFWYYYDLFFGEE